MNKAIFYFLFICLFASSSAFAQTVNGVPIQDINAKYIEIVGAERTLSKKMNIEIEFGQEGKLIGSKNTKVEDENGERVLFNSMVSALNFMDENGYKYLDSYITKYKDNSTYHYILIRKDEKVDR
jgi:hypothetical protein